MTEQSFGEGQNFSRENPSTAISPAEQELEAPAKDSVTKLDKLFYWFGKVTRPSSTKVDGDDPTARMERSLLTRKTRAELLTKVLSIPKSDIEGRKKVFEEAHEWDRIAKDFLKQGEVGVTLPGLGEQVGRYNILTPKDTSEQAQDKPPIVIIPGLSNDLDCIANVAQSLAFDGRTVISISYPEAFMGRVTDEFANKVVANKDYSEHTKFFQAAMDKLTEGYDSVELWGLSSGGPIAAEMLADEKTQQKISNAVLISPAGCVDQSPTSMKLGVIQETPGLLRKFGKVLPRAVMTTGKKEHIDEHQLELRKTIFNSLFDTICHKSPDMERMRVREGGHITVISGGKDQITKSYKAIDELQKNNPQVRAIILPDENHTSSFNSQEVLDTVNRLQDR